MSAQAQTNHSSQTTALPDRSLFLRRALMGNALFSAISGSEFLFLSHQTAGWLGFPDASTIVMIVGLLVLLFAPIVWWVARQSTIDRRAVQAILILDIVWVLVSVVLLVSGWLPFSTSGYWIVAILADIVAIFAILEFIGLKRL